jgi:uncharacterized protein YkwD
MRRVSSITRGIALVFSVVLAAAAFALVRPATAPAAVGGCTPAAEWGTLDTSFASQVVALVNQHRQAMGLAPLGISPTLTASADWKSLHMAYYAYLAHDDPAPPISRTVSDRLAACGYPIGTVGWGENIAFGYSTPSAVMAAWLNSPGHRANIENPSYRAIGVGVARSSSGLYYWTQDFGTLLDSGSTPPPPTVSPPTVSITSAPAASTSSTTASFAWATSGSPTNVSCSLDGAIPAACSSPRSYSALAAGVHRFVVTVTNSAGSASASYSWSVTTVSVAAPTVSITGGPAASTTSTSASFWWTTAGSPTSMTCSLDGGAATPCVSPTTYAGLLAGTHRFVVTVANAAGSSSAAYTWTIGSSTAYVFTPTITFTSVPAATTTATSAYFTWRTTGSPTSTTCALDGGAPVACGTSKSYVGLPAGQHHFLVTVSNTAGSASKTDTWTIVG